MDTSSDSEPEEQKSSSAISTPSGEATAYYYQLGGSKHLLTDPPRRRDSFHCKNENEPNNVVQEVAYANLTTSTVRKTGAGLSNLCTRSNYKINASNIHASKQLKRVLSHRAGQCDIHIAV